jgi:DNA-binding NtrC family response regulator
MAMRIAASPMPLPHARPLTILLVEDDDYLRESIVALLEGDDRQVRSCASAEAALADFAREPCDVVITDVSLPGLSGIDLARRLVEAAPRLWVVISSGYELDHGLDRIGPNVRSLSKPFEIEAMDALLGEIHASLAA